MKKVNEKQKNMLIEMLKSNPDLVSGKFSATFTYEDGKKKWIEISNTLNSIPGAKKEWKNWRKTWQDIRSRTKTKYAKNKRNLNATGGGPFVEDPISSVDEDIMGILKPVCLDGHKAIVESAVNFEFLDDFKENENNHEAIGPDAINNLETTDLETTTTKISKGESSQMRITPKRGGIKLRKTERAVISYENMMTRKLDIKEKYYEQKIELLKEQNKILNESGKTLTKIASVFETFLQTVNARNEVLQQ